MEEKSKVRMNLVAIKKVDPYAKDIVDSSSHVAFYTFNSDKNEWEKTDVEGAFFIYRRNAQPYHSIFINNRLNTTSFVEPITTQLELQSQPPFLLYRNERSRIRGFWFYNSNECDRISSLVSSLVEQSGSQSKIEHLRAIQKTQIKQDNVDLFKMLSDAQKEYNLQLGHTIHLADAPTNNVLEFFAAAKPATSDKPFYQKVLANTLSVQQIEKQQRKKTDDKNIEPFTTPTEQIFKNTKDFYSAPIPAAKSNPEIKDLKNSLHTNTVKTKTNRPRELCDGQLSTTAEAQSSFEHLFFTNAANSHLKDNPISQKPIKPALMLPTMFEKPRKDDKNAILKHEPLNANQLVQAFNYLMQNDAEFVQKLHEAYLQIYAKKLVDTYQ